MNEGGEEMSDKKDIGVLWTHESKKGVKYLSGSIEIDGKKHEIVIFKNTFKQEAKHPDFRIFPSTPKTNADETPF